jgi:hypothetical protein
MRIYERKASLKRYLTTEFEFQGVSLNHILDLLFHLGMIKQAFRKDTIIWLGKPLSQKEFRALFPQMEEMDATLQRGFMI